MLELNIGKLLPMINPDSKGNTPISGIVIYGIILVLLVAVTKNILRRF